ncbi:UNVERIFIED_CONTAM: Class V chitinase CHIT5b [Sesamum angustifolium]|uniref:Class V chitinase CHIT5b n=1 Tax=Sesamum angustifolium TaxID=2727405 RepID=A0AAW2KM80_9LAMI
MGLPLYGRTWQLKDPRFHGVGAPAVGVGSGQDGALTYAEVVKFNRDHKAKVVYDWDTVSVYSVVRTSWVEYDDTTIVTAKIRYARGLELRGYFFWVANGDYEGKILERGM